MQHSPNEAIAVTKRAKMKGEITRYKKMETLELKEIILKRKEDSPQACGLEF
jgi:hypothetical protein